MRIGKKVDIDKEVEELSSILEKLNCWNYTENSEDNEVPKACGEDACVDFVCLPDSEELVIVSNCSLSKTKADLMDLFAKEITDIDVVRFTESLIIIQRNGDR